MTPALDSALHLTGGGGSESVLSLVRVARRVLCRQQGQGQAETSLAGHDAATIRPSVMADNAIIMKRKKEKKNRRHKSKSKKQIVNIDCGTGDLPIKESNGK